jgi:CHASE2 domain-containing sensor protein
MRRIRRWWARASKRQRHFVTNVAIGIAISILMSLVETNAAVGKLRDTLLTWQVAQLGSSNTAAEILWIDIDDDSYLRWYAPAVTPRDRLCRLIDFAVRGGARTVVVDVDLTNPTPPGRYPTLEPCSPGSGRAPTHGTADGILVEYLRNYARMCAGAAHCATIVLVRSLRSSYDAEYGDGAPANTVRPSFLDAAVRSGSNVLWSSPNFELDDDFIVRRWRLWEPLCDPRAVLPSTELVAAAAFAGSDLRRVRDVLDGLRPKCQPRGEPAAASVRGAPPNVTVEIGYPAQVGTDEVERRFFYRVGWDAARERPAMAFVPALSITDAAGGQAFSTAVAAGRIVVIGGSYRDNPDLHRTPLGIMPGTLVLINAIHALVGNDHVRETPLVLRIAVEGLSILLVSGLFLYLAPLRAMLISSVLVLGAAFTVGYAFLNGGYWLDPVLPLIGIQVHEAVALVERRRHREGEHR